MFCRRPRDILQNWHSRCDHEYVRFSTNSGLGHVDLADIRSRTSVGFSHKDWPVLFYLAEFLTMRLKSRRWTIVGGRSYIPPGGSKPST